MPFPQSRFLRTPPPPKGSEAWKRTLMPCRCCLLLVYGRDLDMETMLCRKCTKAMEGKE